MTGETHFGYLVQQIEDCADNIVSQKFYTPVQTVLIGFNIIDKCCFYSDNWRDWGRKSKLDKTRPTFKVHFTRAFKETRESNKTAVNSGYVTLVRQVQTDMQKVTNENEQSIANYTNKSAADTNAIKKLK